MSRTIRVKPPEYKYTDAEVMGWYSLAVKAKNDKKTLLRYKAKEKSDCDSGRKNTLPKFFRKIVAASRRARDKREIHKAVSLVGYEPNMSPWSCKDSNSWGYW